MVCSCRDDRACGAVAGAFGSGELFVTMQIIQSADGYRYSIDPFLLAAFAHIPTGARVVDLGSGSGVVALLLGRQEHVGGVVGLELQAGLVERSRQSVVLNGLQDRVDILQGDVRELPQALRTGHFDVVVTNPPYRPVAAGRLSQGDERCLARHELAGGLADFLRAANLLLKANGRFYMVHLAERLAELLAEMRGYLLEPKRLRMVHSRAGDGARLILVEGRKNARPGLKVEPPLFIYQGSGREYTEEVRGMYGLKGC